MVYLVIAISAAAIWQICRVYEGRLRALQADNTELRDRLFAKHQMPPSGVNLTEAYVERKEQQKQQRDDPQKRRGPVETFAAAMTAKDLKANGSHRMAP